MLSPLETAASGRARRSAARRSQAAGAALARIYLFRTANGPEQAQSHPRLPNRCISKLCVCTAAERYSRARTPHVRQLRTKEPARIDDTTRRHLGAVGAAATVYAGVLTFQ